MHFLWREWIKLDGQIDTAAVTSKWVLVMCTLHLKGALYWKRSNNSVKYNRFPKKRNVLVILVEQVGNHRFVIGESYFEMTNRQYIVAVLIDKSVLEIRGLLPLTTSIHFHRSPLGGVTHTSVNIQRSYGDNQWVHSWWWPLTCMPTRPWGPPIPGFPVKPYTNTLKKDLFEFFPNKHIHTQFFLCSLTLSPGGPECPFPPGFPEAC